mgnify:FL=1
MITFPSWLHVLASSRSPWMHWPFGPSLTGGWLETLAKFVFIGLVLAGILLLLRWAFGPGGRFRDQDDGDPDRQSRQQAMDILRRRLAEGQITPEEFAQRKELIESDDD